MKKRPKKIEREQGPEHFHKWLRLGTQALQRGETDKAVRFLERAYQLDSKNPDAALNLGGAYILSKKFSRAVAVLELLSQQEPHNPMVWTNLGAAYLGNPILAKDEDQLRAIAAFEQALELNPIAPNVAYNLGLVYLDRQEHDQALRWFERAIQTNPNDRDARRFVAQLSQPGVGEENNH
ncbi:MAG: tetratricopeptide repeat protein [Anaerolineae bacterium]